MRENARPDDRDDALRHLRDRETGLGATDEQQPHVGAVVEHPVVRFDFVVNADRQPKIGRRADDFAGETGYGNAGDR